MGFAHCQLHRSHLMETPDCGADGVDQPGNKTQSNGCDPAGDGESIAQETHQAPEDGCDHVDDGEMTAQETNQTPDESKPAPRTEAYHSRLDGHDYVLTPSATSNTMPLVESENERGAERPAQDCGNQTASTEKNVAEKEAGEVQPSAIKMFVKFMKQPDGSVKPVELVTEGDLPDKDNILTDPTMVKSAEQFTASHQSGGSQRKRPASSRPSEDAVVLPKTVKLNDKRMRVDMKKPHPCKECGLRYKTAASLKSHVRLYHEDNRKGGWMGFKCGELDCWFLSSGVAGIRNHLEAKHGIHMNMLQVVLRDWEEFESWRKDYEEETGVQFRRSSRTTNEGETVTVSLNCPGNSPTVYRRRRKWRQKAGGDAAQQQDRVARVACTAFVRASRTGPEGQVFATINTTHYGHSLQPASARGRLKEPLPETVTAFIKDKLEREWPLTQILAEARRCVLENPVPSNSMYRVQRNSVYAVARRLGLAVTLTKTGRDTTGVETSALARLIDSLTASKQVLEDLRLIHLLLYKKPGEPMEGVSDKHTVVAFTSPRQLQLLHAHGSNVIIMEATDVTRERSCRLTSICAMDGTGDLPQPVAWMISSCTPRQLSEQLILRLGQLSEQECGLPLPAARYMLVENTTCFHSLWTAATGYTPQRLLEQARVRATLGSMLYKYVQGSAERQTVGREVSAFISLTGQEADSDQESDLPTKPRTETQAHQHIYRRAASLGRRLCERLTTRRFGVYLQDNWLGRGLIEEWQSAFRRGVQLPVHSPARTVHEAVAAEYLSDADRRIDRAMSKLVEFCQKWHEPEPEKDALAPKTMAKYFPESVESPAPTPDEVAAVEDDAPGSPAGWGPQHLLQQELRLRLEGLVNRLDAGLSQQVLLGWRQHVHGMEMLTVPAAARGEDQRRPES